MLQAEMTNDHASVGNVDTDTDRHRLSSGALFFLFPGSLSQFGL